MRSGGGKGKGSAYERQICKQLSLWVTAGKRVDCFWRSAMSGGRATIAKRKGIDIRQSGDITAVSPEGHALTNRYFIECKHYRSLDLESFFIAGKGKLASFWKIALREARKHNKDPLLLVRQNRTPDLVITKPGALKRIVPIGPPGMSIRGYQNDFGNYEARRLEDVLSVAFDPKG